MEKTLSVIGNSLRLIIERDLLDLLDINKETKLEIRTDGEALIIRPIREGHRVRVKKAAERVMDRHDDTLRKLGR